ncbi:MAG TPA: isoprenylcysteine carboxylmethyltransferase family protein [Draconibacterium sp.]|nr:isoprenylcysteine carboxylmethyltransferase family protein [Draconibacterium sp.]
MKTFTNKKYVTTMKKLIYIFYAIVCYFIFFASFLYMIGFVENITNYSFAAPVHNLFPKTLDTGTSSLPLIPSVLIDLFLVALFGMQHSIMARQGFKKKWTKLIPRPIERSTYVLSASAMLIVLYLFWQPIKFSIWNVSQTITGNLLVIISMVGWGLVVISTYIINHFDLFGLLQVFRYARNKKPYHPKFQTPLFYKIVRHPLYLGFLIVFWVTPVMTIGHLVFSAAMTIYILIGIYHEEKDLVRFHGNSYQRYREEIPKIIPFTSPISQKQKTRDETNSEIVSQKKEKEEEVVT